MVETDKLRPGAGETSMPRGRDVAWSNARPLRQKQKPRPHARERSEAENLRPLNIHQQPIPRSPTSGKAASKPSCVEDQRMKRPGEKNHREAAEADQSPGEGERQHGQKKKGQDPLLRWLEGYTQRPRQKRRQQNVEPTPLQSRPADQRMTQRHPEDGPEKTRDQR